MKMLNLLVSMKSQFFKMLYILLISLSPLALVFGSIVSQSGFENSLVEDEDESDFTSEYEENETTVNHHEKGFKMRDKSPVIKYSGKAKAKGKGVAPSGARVFSDISFKLYGKKYLFDLNSSILNICKLYMSEAKKGFVTDQYPVQPKKTRLITIDLGGDYSTRELNKHSYDLGWVWYIKEINCR